MKPMPELDALLGRARGLGVFGTKERSVIHLANPSGIADVVRQHFEVGTKVKVTGTTKGRGFQGVVKRHGFGGGRASHGATRIHRAPGSIGAGTNPSRVIKGKRLPGHMGDAQQTVRNLRVAKIDAERNLLYIRGAVPGPINGYVFITKQ